MTKTIRFSNGRLERDGGIVAAPLTGFVRLDREFRAGRIGIDEYRQMKKVLTEE